MDIENKRMTKRDNPLAQDATKLLTADHKRIIGLFSDYEKTRSNAKKKQLVTQICTELIVHTQIEEEIFYPAIQNVLNDKKLIAESIVEHDTLKSLIKQVEHVEPDGEMFDARIKVLANYVKNHIREEHVDMFPKARSNWLDLMELGARMAKRKAELLEECNQKSNYLDDEILPFQLRDLPSVGLGGRPNPNRANPVNRRVSRDGEAGHIHR